LVAGSPFCSPATCATSRWSASALHFTTLHCTALQIRALLLVAPAINFFRPHYARLAASLPEDAVRRLDQGEVHVWEDETGVTHLRKSFAERSAGQELELAGGLGPGVAGPVRILHGGRDASVPYTHSLNLLEALRCEQVPPPALPRPPAGGAGAEEGGGAQVRGAGEPGRHHGEC
jgi:hypothetical protein